MQRRDAIFNEKSWEFPTKIICAKEVFSRGVLHPLAPFTTGLIELNSDTITYQKQDISSLFLIIFSMRILIVLRIASHSSGFVNFLLNMDDNRDALAAFRTSLEAPLDNNFVANVVIIPFNKYFMGLINSL